MYSVSSSIPTWYTSRFHAQLFDDTDLKPRISTPTTPRGDAERPSHSRHSHKDTGSMSQSFPSGAPDPLRLSVRKALRDALDKRYFIGHSNMDV